MNRAPLRLILLAPGVIPALWGLGRSEATVVAGALLSSPAGTVYAAAVRHVQVEGAFRDFVYQAIVYGPTPLVWGVPGK